jgi:hypothetical protein
MDDKIKIEKGIPVPERPSGSAAKYPWNQLEVGDSFVVPRMNGEPMQLTRERAGKAIQFAKKRGWTFCTRQVETGIRVWRLT